MVGSAIGRRSTRRSWAQLLFRLLKADLWEVLAIIGVTQLCLLPLVGRSTAVRVVAMLLSLVAHVGLSYAFNFAFVLGLPNAVDRLLGTTGQRCWDGGLFGLISWSFVMLAGTVAFDLVRRSGSSRRAVAWLFAGGVACCAAGYAHELCGSFVRRPGRGWPIATVCGVTRLAALVGADASIGARPAGRAALGAGARHTALELLADEQTTGECAVCPVCHRRCDSWCLQRSS